MNNKLSVGEVLNKTFETYMAHWKPLLTISVIFQAIGAVIGVVLAMAIAGAVVSGSLVVGLVGGAAGMGAVVLVGMFQTGMTTLLVDDIRDGSHDSSFGELFERTKPKLGALFVAGLLSMIIVMVGIIFLVIPGIIMAILLSLVAVVVMLENTSGSGAISRSIDLVKSNFWSMLGLLVCAFLITAIFQAIVGGIFGAILGDNIVGEFVKSFVPSTITTPVSALVSVLAYNEITGGGNGTDSGAGGSDSSQLPPPPPATPGGGADSTSPFIN